MEHRAVSSRHSVAFGIVLVLVAMASSFLAVLAVSSNVQIGSAAQAQYSGSATDECANASQVRTFTGTQGQTTEPFQIRGDKFRLAFETERDGSNARLKVTVFEGPNPTGQSFVVRNGDDGSRIIPLGPGTFKLELDANNNLRSYRVTVEDCLRVAAETTAQEVTTAQTTTPTTTDDSLSALETTTADAEAQTADVNSDADAFRCDFFLHVVRDEQGGVRDQYRDDELIVRRFEQCLSEEVLTDTIPNRRLPGTGGPALLGLAALGLASLVAGASVLRAGTRRRGGRSEGRE